MIETPAIFIGYDPREDEAYQVCVASIIRHSRFYTPPPIIALDQKVLRTQGAYWRPQKVTPVYDRFLTEALGFGSPVGVQHRDLLDGRPFSTEFAFTRFLVPYLCGYEGRAIYCDCDFMFRANVLDAMSVDLKGAAIAVVKHVYEPVEALKMGGVKQAAYPRKNWSSFIVWDCGHSANKRLGPEQVNSWTGRELHRFGWLRDRDIEPLDRKWNWLAGHSDDIADPGPAAVHWTSGGPWISDYRDAPYAEEYRTYLEEKLDG